MTVGANATEEQVNTAIRLDFLLVASALSNQILSITVKNVHILSLHINMAEEVVPHERMIALGVLLGQPYILVHVECNHILEAYDTFVIKVNQLLICTQLLRYQ